MIVLPPIFFLIVISIFSECSCFPIEMLLFKSGIKGRIPQVGTSYHNKKISCSQLCWSRSFSIKPDFQNELDEKYFKYPQIEKEIYNWWDSKGFFKPLESSNLDSKIKRFVLPMPPPNVTGYLHMGHAIFLALQDIMVRFHRMKGYSTLWIPGTLVCTYRSFIYISQC